MVVALLVTLRFANRRDTAGEPYDSIKTRYFYGFIALNILYMIVALVIGVPSAGVLVAHLLLMGLLTIVTFTIFHEKGYRWNQPTCGCQLHDTICILIHYSIPLLLRGAHCLGWQI